VKFQIVNETYKFPSKFPSVDNACAFAGLAEKARDRYRGGFSELRARARDADF